MKPAPRLGRMGLGNGMRGFRLRQRLWYTEYVAGVIKECICSVIFRRKNEETRRPLTCPALPKRRRWLIIKGMGLRPVASFAQIPRETGRRDMFHWKKRYQIVFDIETDGSKSSRVCQLSYLIVSRWRVKGKNMYFSLDYMNYHAQKVHGLSVYKLRRLSGGQVFADRAEEIYRDFAGAEVWIGHDVQCDVRYLTGEFKRIGKTLTPPATFCTLKRYTREANIPLKQNPSKLKPPRLEELMQHFGITPELVTRKCKKWFGGGDRAHDARYDTVATYLCMLVGEEKA